MFRLSLEHTTPTSTERQIQANHVEVLIHLCIFYLMMPTSTIYARRMDEEECRLRSVNRVVLALVNVCRDHVMQFGALFIEQSWKEERVRLSNMHAVCREDSHVPKTA